MLLTNYFPQQSGDWVINGTAEFFFQLFKVSGLQL